MCAGSSFTVLLTLTGPVLNENKYRTFDFLKDVELSDYKTDLLNINLVLTSIRHKKVCDTSSVHLHQGLQFTVWALQELPQQLHTWILHLVLTEVQFRESGRAGFQSWGQVITAVLWQPAAPQSKKKIKDGEQMHSLMDFSALCLFGMIKTI